LSATTYLWYHSGASLNVNAAAERIIIKQEVTHVLVLIALIYYDKKQLP